MTLKRLALLVAAVAAGIGFSASPAAASDYVIRPAGIGVDHLGAASQSYGSTPLGTDVEIDDYYRSGDSDASTPLSDTFAGPFRCPDKGVDGECLGTDGKPTCIGDGRSPLWEESTGAGPLSDARKPGNGLPTCVDDSADSVIEVVFGIDSVDGEIDGDDAVIDSDN